MRTRVGIIGAGAIARAHALAIGQSERAALTCVYDLNLDATASFCAAHGGRPCDSVGQLLDEVDLVVIATPNFAHYQHFALAALHGVSVLCEKPLASSVREAESMLAMAAVGSARHFSGHNYRFLPIMRTLKALVDGGELGNIISVKVEFLKDSALRKQNISWRDQDRSQRTSGSLGDLGSHLIDAVTFLTGQNVDEGTVRASTRTAVAHKGGDRVEVDDNAYVCCSLTNGCFVELRTSKTDTSLNQGFNIVVHGALAEVDYRSRDKNVYRLRRALDWELRELEATPRLADPEREVFGWADSFMHQLDDICSRSPRHAATLDDGYRVQRFIDRVLNFTLPRDPAQFPDPPGALQQARSGGGAPEVGAPERGSNLAPRVTEYGPC